MTTLGPPPLTSNLAQDGKPSTPWANWFRLLWETLRAVPWTAAAYQNDFSDWSSTFYGAAYRKEQGRVWVRGLVKTPTPAPAGYSAIFTLPAGYRPTRTLLLRKGNSVGVTEFEVTTDGLVRFASTPAGSALDVECSFSID